MFKSKNTPKSPFRIYCYRTTVRKGEKNMNIFDIELPSTPDTDSDGVLAMAFVNVQPLDTLYDIDRGFPNGTIFPDLYKPLDVMGGMMR